MNKKYVLIILVASILVYFFFSYIYNNLVIKNNMEIGFILKEDLNRGQDINENNLIKVDIKKGTLNNLAKIDDVSDKVLNCDLKRGQVLLKDYCINKDEYIFSNTENEIICLKIESSEDFVSYQVKKDSIVNVYYTGKFDMANKIINEMNLSNIKSNENSGYISVKLLENIKVIDVFDNYGNSIKMYEDRNNLEINTIMIEVKKEMINKINNLKNYGKFSLSIVARR